MTRFMLFASTWVATAAFAQEATPEVEPVVEEPTEEETEEAGEGADSTEVAPAGDVKVYPAEAESIEPMVEEEGPPPVGVKTTAAPAGACHRTSGLPVGPVMASVYDGDLGRARRVCTRSEVSVGAGALMVVDTYNFYGHIVAGADVEGSWAVSPRTELFIGIEAVRYETVIQSVAGSTLGFGHTRIGAQHAVPLGDRAAMAVHGKVVLPTSSAMYKTAWPFAADIGLATLWAPHDMFDVHANISVMGSVAATKAAPQPRGGVTTNLNLAFTPVAQFSIAAEVATSLLYTGPLDYVSAGGALRFSDGKRFGMELGAIFPLVGEQRALLALELRTLIRL